MIIRTGADAAMLPVNTWVENGVVEVKRLRRDDSTTEESAHLRRTDAGPASKHAAVAAAESDDWCAGRIVLVLE
jgi:hypothetical protein